MIHWELIDKQWTLFLDRDGVINHEKSGDYIRHAGEFHFYDGVPEAMAVFAARFGRIFIVTNQKGIGRGLMTEADLTGIHDGGRACCRRAGG
jgi:HAD superfamily hydrolase (TIGR01662 family)